MCLSITYLPHNVGTRTLDFPSRQLPEHQPLPRRLSCLGFLIRYTKASVILSPVPLCARTRPHHQSPTVAALLVLSVYSRLELPNADQHRDEIKQPIAPNPTFRGSKGQGSLPRTFASSVHKSRGIVIIIVRVVGFNPGCDHMSHAKSHLHDKMKLRFQARLL